MYRISQWILRLLGWTIMGHEVTRRLPKSIIAVVPHTSNWDFPLGILVRSASRIKTRFLGKKSLFRPPFGWIFYALGGYPVDRSKHTNLVDATVKIFNRKETFSITLAPEGTRSKVDQLKTGFYYIAKKANVPIVLTAFDFGKKQVRFAPPFYPTDDFDADWQFMLNYYIGVEGKNKELSFQPQMGDKRI